MKTIVVASTKGGVGKTTLTAALAVEAGSSGKRVAVIDLDPMQSAARWFELRDHADTPVLITDVGPLAVAISMLKRDGWDYVFVDTPPGPLSAIIDAIKCADLVIVPCRPSPIDVEATDLVGEIVDREHKPLLYVLNAIPRRSRLIAGAADYLRAKGGMLADDIAFNEDHPAAMIGGHVAREEARDGEASQDVARLWRTVKKHVDATKHKRTRTRS